MRASAGTRADSMLAWANGSEKRSVSGWPRAKSSGSSAPTSTGVCAVSKTRSTCNLALGETHGSGVARSGSALATSR